MESETVYVIPHPEALLVVEETDSVVVVEESIEILEVTTPGPQGKTGLQGIQGIQGEQGIQGNQGVPGSGFYYKHVQGVPSDTWVVTHNLGSEPNVEVFDSTGRIVEGDVEHNSPVQTTIRFAAGFSGAAVFS